MPGFDEFPDATPGVSRLPENTRPGPQPPVTQNAPVASAPGGQISFDDLPSLGTSSGVDLGSAPDDLSLSAEDKLPARSLRDRAYGFVESYVKGTLRFDESLVRGLGGMIGRTSQGIGTFLRGEDEKSEELFDRVRTEGGFGAIGPKGEDGKYLPDINTLFTRGFGKLEGYASVPFTYFGSKIAGLAEDQKREDDNFITYDLPQALGQAVGYLAGGLATKAPAFVGLLGAADQGQAMYEDAKSLGASEEDARLAFYSGNVIGGAEALPFAFFLSKVNRYSGGLLSEGAKNLASKPSLILDLAKGFLIEGGTETVQQLAENWVAKDIVGYDPMRTLDENLLESFYTGGAVGSILFGGASIVNRGRQRELRRQYEQEYQDRLASGDPINFLGSGQFTPIGDIPALQERRQETEDSLINSGANAAANPIPASDPNFISPQNQQQQDFNMPASQFFDTQIANLPVDILVNRNGVKEDGVTPMTVKEAFESGIRTTVSPSTIYSDQLAAVRGKLQAGKKILPKITDPAIQQQTQDTITQLEATEKQLVRKAEMARTWLKRIKEYVDSFQNNLSPDTLISIGDFSGVTYGSVVPQVQGGGAGGVITFNRDAVTVDGVAKPVMRIEIDTDLLATARYMEEQMGKGWYSTPETNSARRAVFERLNHELGHLIVTNKLLELRNKAAMGDTKSALIYEAVKNDYDRFRVAQEISPLGEYFENVATPEYAAEMTRLSGVNSTTPTSGLAQSGRDYLFSFDEFFAQQMARLATQGKLANLGVATDFYQRSLDQYQEIFKRLPSFAKGEYSGNFQKFLEAQSLSVQITKDIAKAKSGGPKSIYDAIRGLPGFDVQNFAGLREQLDQWNRVMDYGYNLIQVAKENLHIEGLQRYLQKTREWASYVRQIDARAVETIKSWRNMAKKKAGEVGKVLYDEREAGRRFTPQELAARLPTLEQQQAYAKIRGDLDFVFDQISQEGFRQAYINFPDNETLRNQEIAQIQEEINQMKVKGYFPYMRFGKWTLTVRDAEGKLTGFETFESRGERDRAAKLARTKYPGQTLSVSVMRDSNFVVQGLPAAMLRSMRDRIPNLSQEQKDAIEAALKDLAPLKGIKANLQRARGVAGYSLDAQRSYAQYMRMAAGHLARVKYADELTSAVNAVNSDVKVLSLLGKDATKRQQIANWMSSHMDYIFNPVNELAGLRSAVYTWYLGYNVKTALINLSQVPMITYPYLAARYGDLQSARALASANVAAVSYWKNRTKWTQGSQKRQEVAAMLETLKKAGLIDQALATELAIAASDGTIDRAYNPGFHSTGKFAKHIWYKYAQWGAFPQAVAEKMNRTVTAIATFDLARGKGRSFEQSVADARDALESTQYENSRWNRPRMMRGKLGTVFVFQSYVQNTLYFVAKDPGARRTLILMMAMGGLLGAPFADDFEELISWITTNARELLGIKNPKYSMEQEMREVLQELHANPDLVLHGLGQSSFGLPAIGEMVGVPLPEFDVSRSMGLGKVIPGMGMLNKEGMDKAQVVNEALVAVGGAGAGAFDSTLRGINSDNPDAWKRTEAFLPTWMKNLNKAARYYQRGAETTASGEVIAEFDPFDLRDQLTIFGQGLGFTPTEVTKTYDRLEAEREAVVYYRIRQEGILRQHNWAFYHEDEEAVQDARQEIKEFNDVVPYPEMQMNGKQIGKSLKQYVLSQKKAEMGVNGELKFQRLLREIEASYGPPDEPGTSNTP